MGPKGLFLPSLPYPQYFGGVSALTPDQYLKMNGFPNEYWGWGGEDDDIAARSDSLPLPAFFPLAWSPVHWGPPAIAAPVCHPSVCPVDRLERYGMLELERGLGSV